MERNEEDLNAILNTLFGFAKEQLRQRGEFFPFAAVVYADSELRTVTARTLLRGRRGWLS